MYRFGKGTEVDCSTYFYATIQSRNNVKCKETFKRKMKRSFFFRNSLRGPRGSVSCFSTIQRLSRVAVARPDARHTETRVSSFARRRHSGVSVRARARATGGSFGAFGDTCSAPRSTRDRRAHSSNRPRDKYVSPRNTAVEMVRFGGVPMANESFHNDDPSLERTFRGHRDAVTACAFNPNMKQLVSSSSDHSLMIWNFKPSMRAYRFAGHKDSVLSVAYSPQGECIASGSKDRTVRLWTPSTVGLYTPKVLKAHGGAVRCVRFSKDGRHVVSASQDKTLKLWTAPDGKFVSTLSGHTNWVRSGDFSPDGRSVVSSSEDKTVRLWDVERSACLFSFDDFFAPVTAARFHPDGSAVAAAGEDDALQLWDVRSKKLVQHYQAAHGGAINSVSFHPSGNFLLTASKDNTVKVWDVREGQLFYTLRGHEGAATCGEFSQNGEYFATGGADANVMVWKTNFDRVLGEHSGKNETASRGTSKPVGSSEEAVSSKRSDDVSSKQTAVSKSVPSSVAPPAPALPSPRARARRDASPPSPPRSSPAPPAKEPAAPSAPPLPRSSAGQAGPSDAGPPEALANTLSHIVGQLDVLTQTVSLLEERLRMNEDKTNKIVQIIGAAAAASEES